MAVLVYIESEENKFKKTAYEALSYGKALADKMGSKVSGLVINFQVNNTSALVSGFPSAH
jgi:electron transfer flavoprotein alpha subunit